VPQLHAEQVFAQRTEQRRDLLNQGFVGLGQLQLAGTRYGRQIREHGQIRNSFGDFEPSWIASLDVGAMGAALLADPGLVTDRTTVVGAAERASHAAIAEMVSKTTGRAVRYQPSPRRNGATS
jgi:uncharacterized protein YbjT (DUF2867 family)